MKNKKFLTENDRKKILLEKEKAIVESFSKIFNKIKRIDENEEQPEMENNLVDFDVPQWALSALINGDFSGLSDEDESKIMSFMERVSKEFGNAHFIYDDIEGKDNLGFKPYNDIDNLGSNVYRLYIRPDYDKSLDENEDSMLNKTNDPTKEEMLDYLNSEFGGFEGTDNFSAEEAIYWYAYHNHGGQWSNLYSALSTSQYKPSPMMKSIEDSDDEISIAMYNTLVEKFGGDEISFDGYESDFD